MNWSVVRRPLLAKCRLHFNQAVVNKITVRSIKVIDKEDKSVDYLATMSDLRRRRLYCWGYAETGALGELSVRGKCYKFPFTHQPVRKKFSKSHKLIDVACGYGYTLYVAHKEGGKQLYGSGLNTDLQIGFQSVKGPSHPLKLVFNIVPIRLPLKSPKTTKVLKVAAGRAHSFTLTDCEGVFSFGNNSFGQCARAIVANEEYSSFRELWKLKFFEDQSIVDIVCGHDHSLFLTKCGKVYSCGSGVDGQTGLGHYNVTWKPTLVEGDIKNEKIVKLSSVSDTVLAVNDKGDVFGWGNSEYFQLPLDMPSKQVNVPTYLSRLRKHLGPIKDVAAAGSASMVLTQNGEVYVWGYGILGNGVDFKFSEEPSLIPMTLFGYSQFKLDVKVASLSCSVMSMAAINNKGDLFMWGKNNWGQLGLGHRNDQFYPMKVMVGGTVTKVSCGVDHTMAFCKAFI